MTSTGEKPCSTSDAPCRNICTWNTRAGESSSFRQSHSANTVGGERCRPDEGHKARAPCFSRWLWSWPCTKPKPHKDGQRSLVQLQTCASLTSCSWMIVSYRTWQSA